MPRRAVGFEQLVGRLARAIIGFRSNQCARQLSQADEAPLNHPHRAAVARLVSRGPGGRMLQIRSRLGLSREVFARMLPISTRSLATIESGDPPSDAVVPRLSEDAIGQWLTTPNDAFDGLKPLEVIERGEIDRIWRMIFLLESGQPG